MPKLLTLPRTEKQDIECRIENDVRARGAALQGKLGALGDWLKDGGEKIESVAEFETTLKEKLQEVGLAAVEEYVAKARQVPSAKAVDCEGTVYKYDQEKEYELRSVFGVGSYEASCFIRGTHANRRSEREFVPQDSSVGLLSVGGGLSPNIAIEASELASRMPFDHVKDVLDRNYGYAPSKRSLLGLVDIVAPLAQQVLETIAVEPGEVAVVQVDARGLPRIQSAEYDKRCKSHKKTGRTRKRWRRIGNKTKSVAPHRPKGKKAGKKKQVTVGLIYTLNRGSDGRWEGPYGKVIARLGDSESVFQALAAELDRLEKKPRKVIFISDGDETLAARREKYLPNAIAVLDFYHVCEYLWEAASGVHKDHHKKVVAYFEELKQLLRGEGPAKVLASLRAHLGRIPKKGPGNKGRRKRISDAIRYISKRVDQMPYREQRDEGLEIGSGAIESAVRQVVAIRFDGPGMRWGGVRSQSLLNIVCVRLSSGWESFRSQVKSYAREARCKQRMTPIGKTEAERSRRRPEPPQTMIGMPEAA